MELDQKELKLANIWLAVVGPLSIIVVVALYQVDRFLADNSRRDAEARELYEVRRAQFLQRPSVVDNRMHNYNK